MATRNERIVPFRAVSPGEILGEELKARGITQKAFADRIGIRASHLCEIIKGKRTLSDTIAMKLEETLGISYRTWKSLEADYRYDLAKLEEKKRADLPAVEYEKVLIGEAIRKTREARKLTRDELSLKSGIGTARLTQMEQGRSMTLDNLIRAFKAMGVKAKLDIGKIGKVALW